MSELFLMTQLCLKVRLELDPHACPEFDEIESAALKYAAGRDAMRENLRQRERLFACDRDETVNEAWDRVRDDPRHHSLHADVWDNRDKTVPR